MTRPAILQRAIWSGTAQELAGWWTLHKDHREAVCRMFSHQFGHELRLEVDAELRASRVCRSEEDVLQSQQHWRERLEAAGWRHGASS